MKLKDFRRPADVFSEDRGQWETVEMESNINQWQVK